MLQNFNKPYAQSAEENKNVILNVLSEILSTSTNVLELGSGTGQHAIYFAQKMPHLTWQATELAENIAGVDMWLDEARLDNTVPSVALNVEQASWQLPIKYDAAFTANTLHIMSLQHVEKLFNGLSKVLTKDAIFCSYGPFNRDGKFTSESNARFDIWLKQRDAKSGIRDMEELISFASNSGMSLIDDIEMPANNRILIWKKLI